MNKVQLYWETIKGAIKNPLFILAVIGMFAAYTNGNLDAFVAAALAFVGAKTLVNVGTPTTEADKDLTPLEHFFLSSRTWVAVGVCVVCYYSRRPYDIQNILLALTAGFGLDWIGVAIKGVDFSKFMPKAPAVIVNQPQMAPQVQPNPIPVELPPPVPVVVPIISQVKDRIKLIREYYGQLNKNYRDYFRGAGALTINSWLQHMVQVNPFYTTIELAKEIADHFFGRKLTEQECATIQSIVGLEAVIKSMGDSNILEGFFAAFDKFRQLEWMETYFRAHAVRQSTCDEIVKAASRAKHGDVDIKAAKLALQEFGISAEDADKTQWSGNLISQLYQVNGYKAFDPYGLAGYTMQGDPL